MDKQTNKWWLNEKTTQRNDLANKLTGEWMNAKMGKQN